MHRYGTESLSLLGVSMLMQVNNMYLVLAAASLQYTVIYLKTSDIKYNTDLGSPAPAL